MLIGFCRKSASTHPLPPSNCSWKLYISVSRSLCLDCDFSPDSFRAHNSFHSIIMNIVQLIFTVCDANFNNGSYVLLSGNYVAILGVVFATIWTDQRSWNNNGTRVEGSKNADPSTWDPAPNRRFRSTITFGTAPHTVPHSIVGAADDDILPREKPSTYDVQNRSPSASASEV